MPNTPRHFYHKVTWREGMQRAKFSTAKALSLGDTKEKRQLSDLMCMSRALLTTNK